MPNLDTDDTYRIRFMRISSELFPFASHVKYGYSLDYAAADLKVRLPPSRVSYADPTPPLKAAGDLANGYGHRLTLHPGQFTQIGSPKESVVEASVRELQCMSYSIWLFGCYSTEPDRIDHCSILQLMGMGKDSVMIIHMGV